MTKTDHTYTTVQMEERKSRTGVEHDLEEPFDEDFWLKVRCLLSFECKYFHASDCLTIKVALVLFQLSHFSYLHIYIYCLDEDATLTLG